MSCNQIFFSLIIIPFFSFQFIIKFTISCPHSVVYYLSSFLLLPQLSLTLSLTFLLLLLNSIFYFCLHCRQHNASNVLPKLHWHFGATIAITATINLNHCSILKLSDKKKNQFIITIYHQYYCSSNLLLLPILSTTTAVTTTTHLPSFILFIH